MARARARVRARAREYTVTVVGKWGKYFCVQSKQFVHSQHCLATTILVLYIIAGCLENIYKQF